MLCGQEAAAGDAEEGSEDSPAPFKLPFRLGGGTQRVKAPEEAPPSRRGALPRGGTARIKAAAQVGSAGQGQMSCLATPLPACTMVTLSPSTSSAATGSCMHF